MHFGYGKLNFCLSINYLDRFLSLYELPVSSQSMLFRLRILPRCVSDPPKAIRLRGFDTSSACGILKGPSNIVQYSILFRSV